ncbi:MAG: hypothetical protein V4496_01450 [Pseudomonadota bacterium]
MKKISPLLRLLAIYFLLSITTLFSWHHSSRNNVTGDEPHYLVMASGIAQYKTFEQTLPYQEEFKTHQIYKAGLTNSDEKPSSKNTHAQQGPHGLFSIHNIGLPLLLAFPFLCAGVMGAKITMILLNGLLVVIAWKISALFSNKKNVRFFSVLATCIAFPLIPGSNQVFPDMLVGSICLSALYWLMTIDKKRSFIKEILWMCGIAFLPWLQIKFAATSIILFFAIALKTGRLSRKLKKPFVFFGILIFSFSLLALYNEYAFGKISGPYTGGALVINKTAFMVFIGLLLDQNQGFLMQNLIAFVGLFFVGKFYFRYRSITWLLGLIFLSLIIPNALHPNWYGGWSFSGRFEWSGATTWMLMTLFGLAELARFHQNIYRTVISISLAWQTYLFYRYVFQGPGLYNKSASTDFNHYSTFYGKMHSSLPALYNSDWAYAYIPNYAWSIVVILIIIISCFFAYKKTRAI